MALKAQYLEDLGVYMVSGWSGYGKYRIKGHEWSPGYGKDDQWIEVGSLDQIEVQESYEIRPQVYKNTVTGAELSDRDYSAERLRLSRLAYDQEALENNETIVMDREAHEAYKAMDREYVRVSAENGTRWVPAIIESVTNGLFFSGSPFVFNTMLYGDGKNAKAWVYDRRSCVNKTILATFAELGTVPGTQKENQNTYELCSHSFHEYTKAWGSFLFTGKSLGWIWNLAKGDFIYHPGGSLEQCLEWQREDQDALRNHIRLKYRLLYEKEGAGEILLAEVHAQITNWISKCAGIKPYEKSRGDKQSLLASMRAFQEKLCKSTGS